MNSTRQLPIHTHVPPSLDALLARTTGPRAWMYRGPQAWPLTPGDCYVAVVPVHPDDVDLLGVVRSANRRIERLVARRRELTDLYVEASRRLKEKGEGP